MTLTHTGLAVLILAAGKGTRMKSDTPKILHKLASREMVLHVLAATAPFEADRTVVITGHGADAVEACVAGAYPNTKFIRQTEQLGTGHAVLQAKQALAGFEGTVLILYGDVPLIGTPAIDQFLVDHAEANNAITVASALVENPTGLGRMLRAEDGALLGIQEHKDCDETQLDINEINVGFYAVDAAHLFPLLEKVTNDNAQEEYYLPDIIQLALAEKLAVDATYFEQDPAELTGINNCIQLAEAETILQDRYRIHHMTNGATLIDPATTYFSWDTQLGSDVTVYPNVYFAEKVTVGNGCSVGPFAHLRPNTTLDEKVKVGNFVELKAATIGAGSKVNHLSYIGNANIGDGVNIGAGTIVANYHHFKKEKHATVVKDGASLGANTVLVAPVTVGEKAFVGAGTVVRKDVEDNTLIVSKTKSVIKKDYS